MKNPAQLSDEQLKTIKAAVVEAENKISGEIVPVLYSRSYHYPASKYKLALIFSAITFILLIAADRYIPNLGIYDPLYYFTLVFGAAIIGFIIPVWFPGMAVALATLRERRHAATQKAETIFLEQEIFNTRQRTGILLFISFEEREVVLMADSGINENVEQLEWDNLVSTLLGRIKNKKTAEGIAEAIKACGELLLSKGFKKTDDDINELPDHLISNS